jgi:ATP-binding cassette subfamily B protein
VESGGHDELLEQRGLYYAMWRQQVGERRERPLQAVDRRPALVASHG